MSIDLFGFDFDNDGVVDAAEFAVSASLINDIVLDDNSDTADFDDDSEFDDEDFYDIDNY